MEDISVRQKIIYAVINCIEKEGIHNLTTRSIAQEAGVNIAAINYYFRSKDKLVEETFDYMGKHFISDLQKMINRDDIGSVMEEPLTYLLQGCLKFPNTIKAALYEPFINNNYENIFVKGLNNIFEELAEKLGNQKDTDTNKVRIILLQFLTTSLFTGMFPGIFSNAFIDLRNEEMQEKYIRHVTSELRQSLQNQQHNAI